MLNHDFDEYINNNDISELTYQGKLQELNEKLRLEKQYYEAKETAAINPKKISPPRA